MKKILMLVCFVIAAVNASAAGGVAVGAGGGKKYLGQSKDGNGYPLAIAADKAWKVFAFEFQTTPAQLVDEASVAPVSGMINRVCVESAVGISGASDIVVIWDTVTAANMTLTGAGRRLVPPIQRASNVQSCLEVNAEFTSGVGVMQSLNTGGTYIYWRELGGAR